MRKAIAWMVAAVAALEPGSAMAQTPMVVVDFRMATMDDSVTFMNPNDVRIEGDYAYGRADIMRAQKEAMAGAPKQGMAIRIRLNCKTREARMVRLVNSLTEHMNDPTVYDRVPSQTLWVTDPYVLVMCDPKAKFLPPWQLLNSKFEAKPEPRNSFWKAQSYPFAGLGEGFESYTRARMLRIYLDNKKNIVRWPVPKPVAGLPARTGFMRVPFKWHYDGQHDGPNLLEGGYVELASVEQSGDDLYYYTVTSVAANKYINAQFEPRRHEFGIEVQCGRSPQQRILNIEIFRYGEVELASLWTAVYGWTPTLMPFSKALCDRKFDTSAKRLATHKEVVADMKPAALALAATLK